MPERQRNTVSERGVIGVKRRVIDMGLGVLVGAALFGGGYAVADSGVMAVPTWQPIYVDGQQVEMEAYNIGGHNYVKLRDAGKQVDFNVYWQDGVQVDTSSPYTGVAPAGISISSYKGNTLAVGDRSGLIIGNTGEDITVSSSSTSVITVEQVSGNWVAVAHAPGTATVTVTGANGSQGRLTLIVAGSGQETTGNSASTDLSTNMDIREEMIALINQVRQENGVPALEVNQSLMDAAQICSAQMFRTHNSQFECETAMTCGYPHGFGSNLTVFTVPRDQSVAEKAVTNWVNSSGHFQAINDSRCDTLGVGVTIQNGIAYCYMFAGDPNSHHPYE